MVRGREQDLLVCIEPDVELARGFIGIYRRMGQGRMPPRVRGSGGLFHAGSKLAGTPIDLERDQSSFLELPRMALKISMMGVRNDLMAVAVGLHVSSLNLPLHRLWDAINRAADDQIWDPVGRNIYLIHETHWETWEVDI